MKNKLIYVKFMYFKSALNVGSKNTGGQIFQHFCYFWFISRIRYTFRDIWEMVSAVTDFPVHFSPLPENRHRTNQKQIWGVGQEGIFSIRFSSLAEKRHRTKPETRLIPVLVTLLSFSSLIITNVWVQGSRPMCWLLSFFRERAWHMKLNSGFFFMKLNSCLV